MRRSLFLLLLITVILLSLSMTAFAGSLTLNFTGVKGTNAGGVYTGIYYGTLNGGPQQNFMCDDYSDHITFGESWTVNTFNFADLTGGTIGGVTFGTNTRPQYDHLLGGISQLQAYAEALWVAQGLLTHPNTGDPQASIDSFAIWTLLNNTVQSPPGISAGVSSELTDAGNWWANVCTQNHAACRSELSDVTIYVPISWPRGDDRPQEFLGLTPTPEPLSMILMGTFLSLAGGLLGRKKRAS